MARPKAKFNDKRNRYQIIGQMRRLFSYSPLAQEVREKALSEEKGVRGGKRFNCNVCGKSYPTAQVFVDHIEPLIEIGKNYYEYTLEEIYQRMFCDISNLQLICKECHHDKSQNENKGRKEAKKASSDRDIPVKEEKDDSEAKNSLKNDVTVENETCDTENEKVSYKKIDKLF